MAELKIPLPDTLQDELKIMILNAATQAIDEAVKRVMISKDWMTIKDIQSLMNVSANTVSSWIRMGLPVSVVGQKKFINRDNLNAFLAKHEK
ncbi:helix-turn-helix domain-containing protein [Trichococcus sp. K1Tr]|uniref:helix-turn-helix domain-containing protein n=1 Tax=Trichococcus sp. K1Tr TaxID=3020847 RepID=UPI00232D2F01|nr:helix-turn-helix domain-containing protein [Trichococcus sp. K1Tr]MDB6353639.1 helix-turn-helix domain-containing protein [Trichococcus sp. K1Tr]